MRKSVLPFLLLLLSILFSACGEPGPLPLASPQIRAELARDAGFSLIPDSALREAVPSDWGAYQRVKCESSSISVGRAAFSSLRCRFEKSPQKWIELLLSDYAADSSSVLAIAVDLDSAVSGSEPSRRVKGLDADDFPEGLYLWSIKEKEESVLMVEGLAFGRLHLQVALPGRRAEKRALDFLKSLDWELLEKLSSE